MVFSVILDEGTLTMTVYYQSLTPGVIAQFVFCNVSIFLSSM